MEQPAVIGNPRAADSLEGGRGAVPREFPLLVKEVTTMVYRVISVYFEKELFEKISKLAKEKDVAKPAIIRQIVKEYLKKNKEE